MKLASFARCLLASILGPILAGAILLGIAALMEGGLSSVDPEGIAYLIFVVGWSLPGVVAGLLIAWILARNLGDCPRWLAIVVSNAAAGITSGAVFALTFVALGLWRHFLPVVVVPAVFSGMLAAGLLSLLNKDFRQVGSDA